MKRVRLLEDMDAWRKLATKLDRLESVQRLDGVVDEKEAWALAHCFADLEESFVAFLDDKLPRLVGDDLSSEDLGDLLTEIGEELRHISWHIRHSGYFGYLEGSDGASEAESKAVSEDE